MSADEVEHFGKALSELTSDVRGNANALAGLIGGNRNLVATWNETPGRAKKMVDFLAVLGASYQEVQGDVKDLTPLVEGLSNSESDLAKQFRASSTDAKSMMEWITSTSAKMQKSTGLKQQFMTTFGITEASVIDKINESVSKWSQNERRFSAYLEQTDEALSARAASRMSDIEKLGENFRTAKAEALGLLSVIDRNLQATSWLSGAVQDVADAIRLVKEAQTAPKGTSGMDEPVATSATARGVGSRILTLVPDFIEAYSKGQEISSLHADQTMAETKDDHRRQMNKILEDRAVKSGESTYKAFGEDRYVRAFSGDPSKDTAVTQKATAEYSKQMVGCLNETIRLLNKIADHTPGIGRRGIESAPTGADLKSASAAYTGRR